MKRISDFLILIICIIIIFMFYIAIIKGQKEISTIENRTLSKVDGFRIENFINKSFQDNIEEAIPDQLLLSEQIKMQVLSFRGKSLKLFDNILLKIRHNSKPSYVAVSNDIYTIGNEEWLVYKYGKFKFDEDTIKYFNNIDAPKYLYFIESDVSKMYDETKIQDIYETLTENMELKDFSRLDSIEYKQYKQYFYKTDHHWNHKGQYQGYQDIIALLRIPAEEKISILKEEKYPISFYGSKAKAASKYDISDEWVVYKYNLTKEKDVYINGEKSTYGNEIKYDEGQIDYNLLSNHYGIYYGDDYGEVIYNYHEPQKENLLIISNSYSNAINEMIASHFNKTYIVDLRHIEYFEPNEYIKQNEIDKVLILGNMSLFTKEAYFANINLENYK